MHHSVDTQENLSAESKRLKTLIAVLTMAFIFGIPLLLDVVEPMMHVTSSMGRVMLNAFSIAVICMGVILFRASVQRHLHALHCLPEPSPGTEC